VEPRQGAEISKSSAVIREMDGHSFLPRRFGRDTVLLWLGRRVELEMRRKIILKLFMVTRFLRDSGLYFLFLNLRNFKNRLERGGVHFRQKRRRGR
jgi:hypothetical protein